MNKIEVLIKEDIRNRFNRVEVFEEFKIRKNAKVSIYYANTYGGVPFYVGIIYLKGEPVRILNTGEKVYKF